MKLLIAALLAQCVFAQPPEHWVSTWATSPQQPRPFPAPRPPAPPAAGATATPAPPAPPRPAAITGFHNQTLRMIAHTSIGGRRVSIELSNVLARKSTRLK